MVATRCPRRRRACDRSYGAGVGWGQLVGCDLGARVEERVVLVGQPDGGTQVAGNADVASLFPERESTGFGDTRMTEVATPLSLSGFTSAAVDQFAPRMRKLGLEPRQGISTGGAPENRMGDPSKLQPGSMISVELMTGDMSAGADGTVTYIDNGKVYAFGHKFLGVGPSSFPFTRSEVIALLANVNTSFKISSARDNISY